MLRAAKTLVPLFSSPDRASIAASRDIFNSNNVLLHGIYITEFFIVSRSGGNGALGSTFIRVISTFSCINSIGYFILTTLFGLDILLGIATTVLDVHVRRNSTHILPGSSRCRLHLRVIVLSLYVQAIMNLNRLAFCSLDNRMARSFLRSILGTHVRLRLDGAVRAAVRMRDLNLLVPILRASLPRHSMSSGSVALGAIL